MKIESDKQFRIYVISWFLAIAGFIVIVGTIFIFKSAESLIIENYKKEKLAQIISMAGLIDGNKHQLISNKNQPDTYYKQLTKSYTIAAQSDGFNHQLFSLNYDKKNQQFTNTISFNNQNVFDSQEFKQALLNVINEKGPDGYITRIIDENFYVLVPIKDSLSNNVGLLVLQVSENTLNNLKKGLTDSMFVSFGFLSILLMIAAIIFSRKVTGPLELFSQAISRLIHNDFNFKLSAKGFGSFNYLTNQFNTMISRLHLSRNELILLNKSYSRFVPHQLLKELSSTGVKDISLGDSCERVMTILFCDIRGFTTLSETMSPAANFKFINSYLSQIAPVINKHGGTIDKYLGDGIMALFPNGGDKALTAAVEMIDALAEYNKKLISKKLPIIEVGIGLHTGNTMLGTVGTSSRMDATVISDCVNAASRVEAMTKSFCTKILMTEETKRQLTDLNKFKIRYIAECQIKGKTKPVTLYEVYNNDPASVQKEKAQNQALMIKAWKIYISGDAEKAIHIYQRLIEKSPHDQSLFALIERCQTGRL